MVIASRFLHRFGQIMIRFNHNKIAKLTSSKTWKYLNYIRSYTTSKLKKKKKARFGIFFQKKYKLYYYFKLQHFPLDFYKLGLFSKVGVKPLLRSQSHHKGSIGDRFEDLQNWPIFKKKLTLTHRQKVCVVPIMTNDSILDESKYSQQNPHKS